MGITGKIMVTGASGMLAQEIIHKLDDGNTMIYAVSADKNSINTTSLSSNVICFNNTDIETDMYEWNDIYAIINCAFTRINENIQVIKSIDLGIKIFNFAKKYHVKRVLNISSRSIYIEPEEGTLNTENSSIGGGGCIGLGKYFSETAAQLVLENTNVKYTNLRLASINEVKVEKSMVRPMNVFVKKVINHENITIVGGKQVMSYIDLRDAAEGVISVLRIPDDIIKPVYNIGTGWKCTDTLLNIAQKVINIGCDEFGYQKVEIEITPKDVNMHAGMDSTLLKKDSGWEAKYSLEDMIRELYKMYILKGQE